MDMKHFSHVPFLAVQKMTSSLTQDFPPNCFCGLEPHLSGWINLLICVFAALLSEQDNAEHYHPQPRTGNQSAQSGFSLCHWIWSD